MERSEIQIPEEADAASTPVLLELVTNVNDGTKRLFKRNPFWHSEKFSGPNFQFSDFKELPKKRFKILSEDELLRMPIKIRKEELPVDTPGFREVSISDSSDSESGTSGDEPTEEEMINWHMQLEKREREKHLLLLKEGNIEKIRKNRPRIERYDSPINLTKECNTVSKIRESYNLSTNNLTKDPTAATSVSQITTNAAINDETA